MRAHVRLVLRQARISSTTRLPAHEDAGVISVVEIDTLSLHRRTSFDPASPPVYPSGWYTVRLHLVLGLLFCVAPGEEELVLVRNLR